jgi:hypothetical protein
MNKDRLEALLWARVDGTIDPEELAEIEAHLAENSELREVEHEITTIAKELDSLEKVQPPSELRARIESALALATPPISHQAASLLARPVPSWQSRWLPLASSLVIGVAIGYLLHPGASSLIDQSEVTGTMLAPSAEVVSGPVEIRLDDGGIIIANRDGGNVEVEVTLTAEIDIAVTLGSAAGPVRLESLISSNTSATEVTPHNASVVMHTVGPGTARISVIAIDAAEPLRLQVSSGGFTVDERWIGVHLEDHP